MKNFLKIGLLMAMVIGATGFSCKAIAREQTNTCANVNINTIAQNVMLPTNINLKVVSKRPLGNDFCEIVCKTQNQYITFYTPSNGKYVIRGWLFKDKNNLTGARLAKMQNAAFKSLKPDLDKQVAFKYTPKGHINTTTYMITDPLCPFCHKAEDQIKKIADEYHTEINFILFSVHGEQGQNKIVEAICRNFSADEYLSDTWKKSSRKYDCEKGIKQLNQTRTIVQKLGIRGVPVFYIRDGQMISGANMDLLRKTLEQKKLAKN